jgi:hypothetical protein
MNILSTDGEQRRNWWTKEPLSMGPFSIFVTYLDKTSGQEIKTGPILLRAKSEREASDAAIAVADFAFRCVASSVLVQILGSEGDGHPLEIRRPILD